MTLSSLPACVITAPAHELPTRITGPSCRSITRCVAATAPSSELSGFCTATTCRPFACNSGITLSQLDPSANAPCTSTTFLPLRSSDGAAALAGVSALIESRLPSITAVARNFLSRVFIKSVLVEKQSVQNWSKTPHRRGECVTEARTRDDKDLRPATVLACCVHTAAGG